MDYDQFKKEDCDILLHDRLKQGRERLDNAIEEIVLLCEPVASPKSKLDYQHYFCGNTEIPQQLKSTEVRRTALYKAAVALIRAYANISAEMDEAGYSAAEQDEINRKVDFYLKLREEIRMASGETLDMKAYEADMRHLIDNYIQAEDPRQISPFGDLSLIELIVKSGIAEAINSMPAGIQGNHQAVAETIENNVRQKIIKDHLIDPAFFEEMSTLLDAVIKERKDNAITYEEYLKKIAALASKVQAGKTGTTPEAIRTPAQRALYNNLGKNEALAIALHNKIMLVKPDNWRDNDGPREKMVKGAMYEILKDFAEVERIFTIVKKQAEY